MRWCGRSIRSSRTTGHWSSRSVRASPSRPRRSWPTGSRCPPGERALGTGRTSEGFPCGGGLLPPDARRAVARRERHRRAARRTCRRLCSRSRLSRTSRSGSRPASGSRRSRRSSSVCCAEAAPAGADVQVELWSAAPPGLVSPDAKAIQLGLDAFERALGRRPALIRIGGTLPILPALTEKGIPTVVTGFGLPDSQLHSPNERLRGGVRPAGHSRGPRAAARSEADRERTKGPRKAPLRLARVSSASPDCPARGRRRAWRASTRPGRVTTWRGRGSAP